MNAQLKDYNPFDPEVLSCPYDFNRQLREEAPVYKCPNTGIYFVATYDLVVKVATDEKTFSSKFGLVQSAGGAIPQDEALNAIRAKDYPAVDTMLTQDLPEQRRYRKLCQKPFSINSISKYRPYIENLAIELLGSETNDFAGAEEVNLKPYTYGTDE